MRPHPFVKKHQAGVGLKGWRKMPRSTSRRGSRNLLVRWRQVQERLEGVKHVALFLDFDGTLAPICRRPELVRLNPLTRRKLRQLARHSQVRICIISGRRRSDLQKRVRVEGISYIGLHGWDLGRNNISRPPTRSSLHKIHQRLARRLRVLDHIWIEDKGVSLAIHYRGAGMAAVRRACLEVIKCLELEGSPLRILKGKKVWEVLPPEVAGKGAAVRAELSRLRGPVLPFYLGDDTTDEDVFRVLSRGVTVRIGPAKATRARYRLRNPEEVKEFLIRLEAELS